MLTIKSREGRAHHLVMAAPYDVCKKAAEQSRPFDIRHKLGIQNELLYFGKENMVVYVPRVSSYQVSKREMWDCMAVILEGLTPCGSTKKSLNT